MSYFNREKIIKNAKMVRIGLTDDEADRLIPEMDGIIDYIKSLDEVDTDGVEPLITTAGHSLVLHSDALTVENSREEVLAGAPDRVGEYFAVPKIIE